jgi:hypothetical protein
MATTYEIIDKAILGSAQSSVSFTSIDNSYTDLKIMASVRSAKADITDYMYFTFSGSSSYAATKILFGSGSSAGSFNWSTASGITAGIINAASNTSDTFTSTDIYIPNYLASQYKSVSMDTVQEGNTGSNIYATLNAGLSNSNTAISSITFYTESGSNFVTNTSFYLYGIKNS